MFKKAILAAALAGLTATPTFAGTWRWVPGGINASRGDAVLSSNPTGMIGTLLGSLNQSWTHSGMALDGYRIRHNTMKTGDIPVIYNTFLGIKTTPKRLDSTKLRDGLPGIITESTSNAFGADGEADFLYYTYANGQYINNNAVLLRPKNEGSQRPALNAAAGKMEYFNSYYRVYAYTSSSGWTGANNKQANVGNHCSGTIALANVAAGNPMTYAYYNSSLRMTAATVLANGLKQAVSDDAGWFGNFILSLFDSGAKDRIANQVVNCFAFNDCGNTDGRWKSGVGTGSAISPDNLLPVGYLNLSGAQWGYQNPNGAYGTVQPISYYGGYWEYID